MTTAISSPRRISLVVLSIMLLSFFLRVYFLDRQSLWYDEGLSIHLASLPIGDSIARSATTDHPPLHALILKVWMGLAGSGEFALRFVSVFAGTLVVALTHAWARRAGGSRAGAMAAGLIAMAPMAVWYSQEARGYSLLVALIVVADLAFLKLESGNRRFRMWAVYVLACAAAMYTHYFAAFPIAAMNIVFFAKRLFASRHYARSPQGSKAAPAVAAWVAAQLAVAVLYIPWMPNALAQAASNATYFPGRVAWTTVILDTWRAFAGGDSPHLALPTQSPPAGLVWLAVILLGLLSAAPVLPASRSRKGLALLVASIGIPLVLMSMLAWEKPKFAPRYLLPSLPAFVVLGALGYDALLRFRSRLLAALALLPLMVIPLVDGVGAAQIYFDPSAARPDMRAVAAYIDAHDDPGDAVLLVGGHAWPVFDYYYRGDAEVIPLPPDVLPAAQAPLDARATATLASVAASHPRVWLVLWQQNIADPTSIVLDELRENGRRLEVGRVFHEVSLLLFDVRQAHFAPGPSRPLEKAFDGPIRLVGFDLESTQFTSSQDVEFALYFESSGPIGRNFRVFTHLVGPDGAPVAQDDRIAGADSYPTSLWAAGVRMRNRFSIHLPADLPSGDYRLLAGLYDDAGRLPVSADGDAIEIATIAVKP